MVDVGLHASLTLGPATLYDAPDDTGRVDDDGQD